MTSNERRAGVSTGDLTVIALVGALILVGKVALKIPIQLSGHGGVLWIAALIVGRGIVTRRWAATFMGLVGGLLVVFLSPGTDGFFNVFKYVLPGLTIDLLLPLTGRRLDRVVPAVLVGAAAHATKVLVDIAVAVIAGLPPVVIFATIGVDTTLHIAFGALGGAIGAFVLVALHRARIPQLRYLDQPRGEQAPSAAAEPAVDDAGSTS